MRLQTVAVAAFALTLALPAFAAERRPETLRENQAVDALRAELLLQAELARPVLGDEAVELIQERARFARRLDQLEVLIEDGVDAMDEALTGGDATGLLLSSPSAALLHDSNPRIQGTRKQSKWTRGSWMDSPDGAG